MIVDKNKNLTTRPPVVAVLGHIDHGKSTLLDYIRKTNTTEKEFGGITQHISAYEAECEIGDQKRKITFLDTPGHEAFCSLRERGTRAADIAILVVSAEDGVKPQTVEALNCINKDKIPFIVALNKTDKPNANPEKVKQELAENSVLVEGWGGTIPIVAVSAKTGQGIQELLEMIVLQADIEELKGNPEILAEGFVIESHLNPKQGITATLVIKNGTLKTGTFVAAGDAFTPVRNIENFAGQSLKEASFSSPIKIVGWNIQPQTSVEFKNFEKKEEAIEYANQNLELEKEISFINAPEGSVVLDLVIKADTSGSLEAIEHELKKIQAPKVIIKIICKGIGSITEKDIKTASIKKSLVIGFNVKADKNAEALAMRNDITIKNYEIIYELVDYIKDKVAEITPNEVEKKIIGAAKILKIFSKNKDKQVVGARLETGEMKSGSVVEILRREAAIGSGKIKELQIQKIKTDVAKEGQEFGVLIESKIELVPGDILNMYNK